MASATQQTTQASRSIVALPQEVVNKIAAGEVVVRPLNAVKELIENSLDAGATEITVTCKNGGLDLIKVTDNGCGIDAADYEHVCARFATSKLKTVADLQSVSTFGFRGEALASISCMARVHVISRTRDAPHAWTAAYKNCKPCTPRTASAGMVGTQISAEKLFKDYPQRRSVFTRTQEEALGIANVLVKYAINFPHVKFAFIRDDGANKTGSFRSAGNGDQHAIIRQLMPSNLSKNLMDFEVSDDRYKFHAKVCMAHPLATFTSTAIKAKNEKQKIFQLFINNRLVQCPKLKQTIDAVFAARDAYCPFMAVSMQIDPSRMDVNVHPTKEIVYFLDESQIIGCIETKLFELITSFRENGVVELNHFERTTTIKSTPELSQKPFYTVAVDKTPSTSTHKPVNPIADKTPSTPLDSTGNDRKRKIYTASTSSDLSGSGGMRVKTLKPNSNDQTTSNSNDAPRRSSAKFVPPSLMVRVDSHNRSIDEYFSTANSTLNDSFITVGRGEISLEDDVFNTSSKIEPTTLTSPKSKDMTTVDLDAAEEASVDVQDERAVKALQQVRFDENSALTKLLRNSVHVGFVDLMRMVIQSDNCIYLVDVIPILEELFYQKCLRSIGQTEGRQSVMLKSEIGEGIPLASLVDAYLEAAPEVPLPNRSAFSQPKEAARQLISKMCNPIILNQLCEDFGILINASSDDYGLTLNGIQTLFEYVPLLAQQLGRFAYDLICVEWEKPEEITVQVARAIARLNAPHQISACTEEEATRHLEIIRCQLFQRLKTDFIVPNSAKSSFLRLLSTFDAFKIFGRC